MDETSIGFLFHPDICVHRESQRRQAKDRLATPKTYYHILSPGVTLTFYSFSAAKPSSLEKTSLRTQLTEWRQHVWLRILIDRLGR